MEKRKLLIQLDSDPHPSVFDHVVAYDAGADEVLSYGDVKPETARDGPRGHLHAQAEGSASHGLFIGGSNMAIGEKLLAEVCKHMLPQFGLRVSVLLDSNGANTTAAAAVRAAARHLDLKTAKALVLGGTGPVGRRVALLLAMQGADVCIGSRRAGEGVRRGRRHPGESPQGPAGAGRHRRGHRFGRRPWTGRTLVVAAGAAGVTLLPRGPRLNCPTLRVMIDLNAVPPLGLEGVGVADKAVAHDGVLGYGAVGVGDTKMKIHKAAIARLFERNDQVLDAEQIYALGEGL